MQTSLPNHLLIRSKTVAAVILSLFLAGTALNARAQGEIPSGTIFGGGTGPYTYSLSFADAAGATSPIGSVWYAWTATVPPYFYLPAVPSSVSVPAGWSYAIQGNSIQFFATSSANDIQPGHSLSGFSYTASFSPSVLASTLYSGLSVAYSGGIEASPDFYGVEFTVSTVPEPATLGLLTVGAGFLAIVRRRHSR